MTLPALVVTGSSGFLGRLLLAALKDRYRIFGIARRSQTRSGAPIDPNIEWYQVDIADRTGIIAAFDDVASKTEHVETVIHLAAHYDFTGEEHPEYYRTNVDGLRNVLDCCQHLGIDNFVFSSSLAACQFPRPGNKLTEKSPADGVHVYARTKSLGEQLIGLYASEFKPVTVRFAAMFSDWCEYPPLFMFLETWLSRAWNRRILGGHGRSAIPYLHVNDGVRFLDRVLDKFYDLEAGEVLIASPDEATSHEELFLASTLYHSGEHQKPIHMPRPLVLPGIHARCLLGRFQEEMPFERPWMARYVDKSMDVDASATREKLDWSPRPRLAVLRRLAFLLENRKAYPEEWHRRNRAAIKMAHIRPNLRIHALINKHQRAIIEEATNTLTRPQRKEEFPSYQEVTHTEHEWNHRLILHQLMTAIRTRERAVFLSYCRDLAARRHGQGFGAAEVCGALNELERICREKVGEDPESHDVIPYLHQHLTMTVRFACDEVEETFEQLQEEKRRRARRP